MLKRYIWRVFAIYSNNEIKPESLRFIAQLSQKVPKIMIASVYRAFTQKISGFNGLLLLFITLFTSFAGNAQDYQRKISWNKTKSFSVLGGKTIVQPTFTNARHSEKYEMLPLYTESFPLSGDGNLSVQIINPVYGASDAINKTSLGFIPATIEAKAEVCFERKKPSAFVSILPFRKNPATGQIERLESFTIHLSFTPKGQHRSGNNYAANSVLTNGTWHKISVNAEGMYKIDAPFIRKNLNIDPSTINLQTLAIFGNGGGMVPDLNSVARPDDLLENPTLVVDHNGNGKFDGDDYLLFYGQMPDAWNYNPTASLPFSHSKNLYSDNTYYFLTTTNGTGKRAQVAQSPGSPNKTINDFDEHAYHDNDQYNLLSSGKEWVGDKMTSYSTSQSFSFSFPNIITSIPVTLNSDVAVDSRYSSSTTVSVNGATVITHNDNGIPASDYPPGSIPHIASQTFTANSSQLNVNYNFGVSADPSGTAACFIDWFELFLKRSLIMSGDAMTFRSISSVGAGNISQFNLGNSNANTVVWDITNIGAIQQMPGSLNGSQLSFVTGTDQLKEFMAFNTNGSFGNPTYVGKVDNQNLHGSVGQPALVIVTYDDFYSASTDLANFHASADHMTAAVVKTSQIYNEFGSGKPDISAIRDFVKMLYDRAGGDSAKMPRYILLMGDGSFDPKGRIPNSSNFVPTYQSYESNDQISTYTSDDFFGLLDANEGGNIAGSNQLMDVAVGRIPVATETEAADVVTKIKNYKKIGSGGCTTCVQATANNSWRNKLTFIADYLFNGGTIFEDGSDQLAESTRAAYPVYNYEKIYVDAFKQVTTSAGDRYPDANTAILNTINTGTMIVNWVGHGGETNWSNARIFNMADIQTLQNQYLPLFITATCDFSRYDLPDRTAGEWLITNGKGGGIASVTTVRLVYEDANAALNQAVFNYMFAQYQGRYPTLGEITMLTKNHVQTDVTNTRKFTLLGDPALTLDYPRYNVATTMVNNKLVTLPHDTLKALTQVTIKGEIRDDNNNKMTSFSGTIYPLVFDKITPFQTLGNYDPYVVRTFQQYKSLLFKGKASVTNGDFSFTFIVPKDINYQFGNGRISYYADNGGTADAHGYSTDIVIGGSSDTAHIYNGGPKLNLYMNDTKFVYGGTVNADPILLVDLQDPGGINTTGNGLGHDMTAILDDNNQNKLILNNYYETALNDFTKGQVKYPLTKLTDGRHTLKVKAWDIYDNSNEAYTEFVVTTSAKLALNHVYNYPNPFTTHTEFMFEHNSPCTDLNVSVQIFSVNGKLVKSIVQQVHSVGYRVDNIEWDGRDDYGDAIGKGVYVYKISVHDSNGGNAHKFEKLVVLR